MFKFGFVDELKTGPVSDDGAKSKATSNSIPARRLVLSDKDVVRLADGPHHKVSFCDDAVILLKVETSVPKTLSPSGADIIPGVYEGGFKLWEGAVDLAEYLHRTHLSATNSLNDARVIELGAGHAFPSIMAARCGASFLAVHDYNDDVVQQVSLVNVRANLPKVSVEAYAGGWDTLADLMEASQRFDVVLTAETVYDMATMPALADCLLRLLSPKGFALVCGKRYYFGVGGGTQTFVQVLQQAASRLEVDIQVEVVYEVRDGASNVREIVRVRRTLNAPSPSE